MKPFSLACLLHNSPYYMDESVFTMRLVNLRSVTCYMDQNFKEKAHFEAVNLFTSEKRLKLSYKTSINLEDLDFDLMSFNILNCVFLFKRRRWRIKLTRNLIEEDSSRCLKFYHSSQLRRLKSTGRDLRRKRKWVIPSTNMITNMPAPDRFALGP